MTGGSGGYLRHMVMRLAVLRNLAELAYAITTPTRRLLTVGT